jgi:hypothetical protein
MALDPAALGFTSVHDEIAWDERDVMLYALSLGAGDDDLAHTTENSADTTLRAYPWMSVLYCQPSEETWANIGSFDWRGLVHAQQDLEIHRAFPTAGHARATT